MNYILKFCENAETISINTKNIKGLNDLNIKIDLDNDEVHRNRYSTTGNCIFDLNFGYIKKGTTLIDEIGYMRTVELFYPKIFSWRFNGKHIEAMGAIEMKKEYLGIFSRYSGIYNFIKMLRNHILDILKYRNYETLTSRQKINNMILSTGSFKNSQGRYAVDINPTDDSVNAILNKSKNRILTNPEITVLDMKFWVKQLNPDFHKNHPVRDRQEKYTLTDESYSKYPPCIKKIGLEKIKGNYARFLLSTFLLGTHYERDAKHQLDTMLSDEEREHMKKGNCNQQWRAITAKKYAQPSCKTMVETGFCDKDCGRAAPRILDEKEEAQK